MSISGLGKSIASAFLILFASGVIIHAVEGICSTMPTCASCTAGPTICDKCVNTYGLNTATSKCEPCTNLVGCAACTTTNPPGCTVCASAAFTIGPDGNCQSCAANCRTCDSSGPNKCDFCNSGFRLDNTSPTPCVACTLANCAECKSDVNVCDSCKSHYNLDNSNGQTCTICNSFCTFCGRNPPVCSSGFCDPGYGFDSVNSRCDQCAPNCLTCDTAGPGKCDKCKTGYVTQSDGTCVIPCAPNCKSCSVAGAYKCDPGSCNSGYALACGSRCMACNDPHCDTCDSTAFRCSVCQSGYTLNPATFACVGQ